MKVRDRHPQAAVEAARQPALRGVVDLSPLLLLVLAGLWAAVLVPATRGTRESVYDSHTMDGFHVAMRVLARRPRPAGDRTYVVIPTAPVTSARARTSAHRRAHRRVVLVRLVAAAVASLGAAAWLGGAWWWAHLLVDGALLGAVVGVRRAAVRDAVARSGARRRALAARLAQEQRFAERTAQVLEFPVFEQRERAVND